jgi:redox-sensitive bicupin YhaK (pirin superfamily)
VIGGQQLPTSIRSCCSTVRHRPPRGLAGFPTTRTGVQTVTYMLDGRMRHKDNHGHEGVLEPGAVQWMTAGRGIVHSEMPEQREGRMRGFQLWMNLPARDKMTAPRYQEFAPERIPHLQPADGVTVKAIAGRVGDAIGPIAQPATDPVYLDVELAPGTAWEYALPAGHAAFAYVFEGAAGIGEGDAVRTLSAQELGVLAGGDRFKARAGVAGARLILVAGRPLREPVVRHGPFVINTRQRSCRPSSTSGKASSDARRGCWLDACAAHTGTPNKRPHTRAHACRCCCEALATWCSGGSSETASIAPVAGFPSCPAVAWIQMWATRPSASSSTVSRAWISGFEAISLRYQWVAWPSMDACSSRSPWLGLKADSLAM